MHTRTVQTPKTPAELVAPATARTQMRDNDAFVTLPKRWLLPALCAAQVAVFFVLLALTKIAVPFWDMLSFIDEYLTHRQAGTYMAYLWLPDSEHHSVWSRLFTIIDIEVFDGNGPSFQLFGLSCLLSGLIAFCLEVGRSSIRRDMLTLTCMLFLTVPAAIDCAVPMNGCYVQATGFVILSLVLLDGHGEEGRHPSARRLTALIAAMAASFGNAVGLLAWPLLVWSASRGRLCWQWQVSIFAFGVGFIMLYLAHLTAGSAVPDDFAEHVHLLKVADYALAFAGLPWTRAPALAMSGRIVGALLLICSLAVVIYHGWRAPLLSRFERICTGLIVFSLGTVVLAGLGRVDLAAAVVVPVRYAVLLAPMHVGLLGLTYGALPQSYHPKAHPAAVALASLLLGLQIPAAYAAVRPSRDITVLVQRFLVGEWDERMQSTVFPDLFEAKRIFSRIGQQGLYRWLLCGQGLRRLETVQKVGGAMGPPGRCSRGFGMKWRVMLELVGPDGIVRVHEVGGRPAVAEYAPQMIGLTLEEGKHLLATLQVHLVQAQAEDHGRRRRRCQRCGAQRPLKDQRSRRLVSLFGMVEVRAPRFTPCRCAVTCRRTLNPVAEIMPYRCTPEYERTVAKMGSLLPYRRARTLLAEFLPLGKPQTVETTRQRTLRVGTRLEQEAVAGAGSKTAVATKSIALSIDGGHVRAARQYQGRTFEVLLAQVSNDEGKQVVFASVPAEATSQTRQLRGVLHGLGATPATPVTILSDGADGPRSLGEAASPGPTYHVLDWFHLAMRIQHVAQAATSWPDATETDRQAGARLTETIERIRWRLWHGQVKRALDLIAETAVIVDATAEDVSATATVARRVARLLGDLETYVSGQANIIIDYATARRREEPISTAITESTVQWLLHRRMNAQQQMRWSPRGAHLMLKVRTSVVNGTLDRDYAVAERWARRPFRRAA